MLSYLSLIFLSQSKSLSLRNVPHGFFSTLHASSFHIHRRRSLLFPWSPFSFQSVILVSYQRFALDCLYVQMRSSISCLFPSSLGIPCNESDSVEERSRFETRKAYRCLFTFAFSFSNITSLLPNTIKRRIQLIFIHRLKQDMASSIDKTSADTRPGPKREKLSGENSKTKEKKTYDDPLLSMFAGFRDEIDDNVSGISNLQHQRLLASVDSLCSDIFSVRPSFLPPCLVSSL